MRSLVKKLKAAMRTRQGSFLVTGIIMVSVFMGIALAMATYIATRYSLVIRSTYTVQATQAAQSALDVVTSKINDDEYYYKYCSCLGTEVSLGNTGTGGNNVTYTIQNVAPTTGSDRQSYEYIATVVGKVYKGGTVAVQKAYTAKLSAVNPDGTKNAKFDTAVQSGYGEFGIDNTVRVNGGKIISAGNVRAYASSTQEAHINSAPELWAYNYVCPLTGGSTFPRRCSRDEKFAVYGDPCNSGFCGDITVTDLHVPGYYANNIGGRIFETNDFGDANTPPDLPDLDRAGIKNRVVNTISGNVACTSGTLYVGTKPGETTKITGDLLLGNGGTCTIYLQGDVWVLGAMRVGNNSTFYTADTDSSGNPILAAPIVMVDGCCNGTVSINIANNGTNILENAYGIGKILATYYTSYGTADSTLTGSNLLSATSEITTEFEPGSGNAQTHRDLAILSRWGKVHMFRDVACFCDLVGQAVLIGGASNLTVNSPDDVNLGGRQGKIFKAVSFTDSAVTTGRTVNTIGSSTTLSSRPSVTMGSNGLPNILFNDTSGKYLKLATCSQPDCASKTTTQIVGPYTNAPRFRKGLAIGADGFPTIAYGSELSNLVVVKCSNLDCSSRSSATPLTTAGSFQDISLAIGADGFPVISFNDSATNGLRVLKCGNATCSTGNTTTNVDTTAAAGQWSSIAIGVDFFPVISEIVGATSSRSLYVVKCGDMACSSGNTKTLIETFTDGTPYVGTSIAIGADATPIVSYNHGTSLAFLKCTNISCTTSSRNTSVQSIAGYNDVKVGVDGLPIIAFGANSTTKTFKFIRCADAACTASNAVDLASIYTEVGIVTDRTGYPNIAYVSGSNALFLKCNSLNCDTPGVNTNPTANFSSSTSGDNANFTDSSTDSDGSIVAWSWNFGDGGTSASQNPSHTYTLAGTYDVTLTVTDNTGGEANITKQVTVNVPPTANFTSTSTGDTASFTNTSTDSDGTMTYSWNFGETGGQLDGNTSTATNPTHAYTSAGTYTVTLTVTDNSGAQDIKTQSVTVTFTRTTYFFNVSVSAVTDPQNVWTNDANAFDSSTTTSATTTTQGGSGSNYLAGGGTSAPTSGGNIQKVGVRFRGNLTGGTICSTGCATAKLWGWAFDGATHLTATRENVDQNSGGDHWSTDPSRVLGDGANTPKAFTNTLSVPSGGWTWTKIHNLSLRYYGVWTNWTASPTANANYGEIDVTTY